MKDERWQRPCRGAQTVWGSGLTTACPVPQSQKVSSWSPCHIRVQSLFPSLPKNVFCCKIWWSAHNTSDVKTCQHLKKKPTTLMGLPHWGNNEGKHSPLHTIYPKAHNLPSATSVSQLSKLCTTTHHFLTNWLTQKSRRETMATAGRKQRAQLVNRHASARGEVACWAQRVSAMACPGTSDAMGVRPWRSGEERRGKKEHTKGKSFPLLLQLNPLNFIPPPGSPVSKNNLYKGKNCRGREP